MPDELKRHLKASLPDFGRLAGPIAITPTSNIIIRRVTEQYLCGAISQDQLWAFAVQALCEKLDQLEDRLLANAAKATGVKNPFLPG